MAYTSLPGQMGEIKKSVSLNYGCLDLAAQIPMLTRPVVLMNGEKTDTGFLVEPPLPFAHTCIRCMSREAPLPTLWGFAHK